MLTVVKSPRPNDNFVYLHPDTKIENDKPKSTSQFYVALGIHKPRIAIAKYDTSVDVGAIGLNFEFQSKLNLVITSTCFVQKQSEYEIFTKYPPIESVEIKLDHQVSNITAVVQICQAARNQMQDEILVLENQRKFRITLADDTYVTATPSFITCTQTIHAAAGRVSSETIFYITPSKTSKSPDVSNIGSNTTTDKFIQTTLFNWTSGFDRTQPRNEKLQIPRETKSTLTDDVARAISMSLEDSQVFDYKDDNIGFTVKECKRPLESKEAKIEAKGIGLEIGFLDSAIAPITIVDMSKCTVGSLLCFVYANLPNSRNCVVQLETGLGDLFLGSDDLPSWMTIAEIDKGISDPKVWKQLHMGQKPKNPQHAFPDWCLIRYCCLAVRSNLPWPAWSTDDSVVAPHLKITQKKTVKLGNVLLVKRGDKVLGVDKLVYLDIMERRIQDPLQCIAIQECAFDTKLTSFQSVEYINMMRMLDSKDILPMLDLSDKTGMNVNLSYTCAMIQ